MDSEHHSVSDFAIGPDLTVDQIQARMEVLKEARRDIHNSMNRVYPVLTHMPSKPGFSRHEAITKRLYRPYDKFFQRQMSETLQPQSSPKIAPKLSVREPLKNLKKQLTDFMESLDNHLIQISGQPNSNGDFFDPQQTLEGLQRKVLFFAKSADHLML